MKIKRLFILTLIISFIGMVDLLAVNATGTGSPKIYFNGGKYVEIIQGGTYIEQGVFAIADNGSFITDYDIEGQVDTLQPGQYVITYRVEDESGNVTVDNRLVVVMPVGTNLESNPQDIFSIGQVINWGGEGSEYITASTETSDGGFVIVVQVDINEISSNTTDYNIIDNNNLNLNDRVNVIVKYDSDYNILWSEVIGSSIDDRINAIEESSPNHFVFAGNSGRYNSNTYNTMTTYQGMAISNIAENDAHGMDGILGKFEYDNGVVMEWVTAISVTGFLNTDNKMLNDVVVDDDGSVIIAGSIIEGTEGVFFQKFDTNGNFIGEYIDPNPLAYQGMTGIIEKLSSGYLLIMSPDVELYKKSNHTSWFGVQNNVARIAKINEAFTATDWTEVTERMNIMDVMIADDGNILIVGDDTYGNDVETIFQDTNGVTYMDPIHYDRQFSASVLIKLDIADGSFIHGRFVGGMHDPESGNDDREEYSLYNDRAMGITQTSSGEYIIFGKTRSEGGYATDSSLPYNDVYALWAVSFTDDTVNDLSILRSNISLPSNKDSQYNSFLELGSTYLLAYDTESQYGLSLRDTDDYDYSTESDVFLVEINLEDSDDLDFTNMMIEQTVILDEDLNINTIEDLIDESGSIIVDNDIDLIYNGTGNLTYHFDEGNFDHTIPGDYTVPYFIYDEYQNAISGELSITLNDITSPVLTFEDLEIEVGDNPDFLDGVTITDEGDPTVGLNDIVIDEGDFDEDIIDRYDITYTVSDSFGNETVAVRRVEVVDEIGLTIEFEGDLIIEVGTLLPNYLEGVDLSSNRGIDVSLTDVSVNTAPINLMQVGVYEVKYTVDNGDRSGNANRFIRVVDSTAPIFEINTTLDTVLPVDSNEPNWLDYVTVSDNYDSNPDITFVDNVVYHRTGDYLVVFTARDNEGNESYYQLEIEIGDLIAPVIELNGEVEVAVEVFTTYEDEGFNVSDNYDSEENLEIEIDNEIIFTNGNLETTGTFRVKYTAIDTAGNRSKTVERIVHVVDTVPPVIEGIDFKEAVRNEDLDFLDGITVTDNYDEKIEIKPEDITRVADLTKPNGNYVVTITARDAAGNTSTYSYDLYVVNEDAQVSGYIMGAAVVILLGGGILMATRKQ